MSLTFVTNEINLDNNEFNDYDFNYQWVLKIKN